MTVKSEKKLTGLEVAVIGMAGRFPGAGNIEEFWNNLKNGKESVTFFSDEELEEAGVPVHLINHASYVKAAAWLGDKECFDASFFGYTPAEAEAMAPSMRIFHECSWAALEDAGYDPLSYEGLIGCYAGAGSTFTWQAFSLLSGKNNELGELAFNLLSEKDNLATHLAYKLGLKGPCFTSYSACSTSLVAIHLASRALLTGECRTALAGGIFLDTTGKPGFVHQEGMMFSPDGHCRSFDAGANGTIFGEGVGVVVLKRYTEAVKDGDHIYALIKGSAVNNDGVDRVGFTAPGTQGQKDVVRLAIRAAKVSSETITYVETHGTATSLGDPVEMEALKQAFNTDKKQYCAIGAVKSNIGHLDAAAGAAGFIKTVLALYHRSIPPSLHFNTPNARVDFENSPFYVNKELSRWENDSAPLRAGVSSFGLGGTNAHVILEEAPEVRQSDSQRTDSQRAEYPHLLLLSAKSETALEKMTANLVEHLKRHPDIDLADTAFTLQQGRRNFRHRRMTVCSTVDEAIDALSHPDSARVGTFSAREENRRPPVVFMFPGLGSEYVNMGRELYEKEPVFRREMDRCFELLAPMSGNDIKDVIYPSQEGMTEINLTENSQPLTFIFEYALAKLLMDWGIHPAAMIGYSFGEYAAACIAGVFSLEDALRLVTARERLINKTRAGAMLSVPLSREELEPLLPAELSLAIDNDTSCIAAGAAEAVAAFETQMKEKRCLCMRLPSSTAIHSSLMEPIAGELEDKIREIRRGKPQIPYISNVTGTWIGAEQAADPGYWSTHLRQTVRFADGIKTLVDKMKNALFLEVGPGRDISTLVVRYIENNRDQRVIHLVRHPQKDVPDVYFLLRQVGRMWLYGKNPDWRRFYDNEKTQRVSLPAYPFDPHRFPCGGDPFEIGLKMISQSRENLAAAKKTDISEWFYIPSWKRSTMPMPLSSGQARRGWLIFADDCGVAAQLADRLESKEQDVFLVRKGDGFSRLNNREFTVNPRHKSDYDALLAELNNDNKIPGKVVHLWTVTDADEKGDNDELKTRIELFDTAQDSGLYSLLYLAKAIEKPHVGSDFEIIAVSGNVQEVSGREKLCPEKSTLLAAVKVIPQEYPYIICRSIDIELPEPGSRQEKRMIDMLTAELFAKSPDTAVSYREGYRWVQTFDPVRAGKAAGDKGAEIEIPRLRKGGVYLLTGGLGGIGLILAKYLAETMQAKLVLTGRSPLPPREEWEQWLATHGENDRVSIKINKIRELEELGAEVLVFSADAANRGKMADVISRAEEQFGQINGVIHGAGMLGGEGFNLVKNLDKPDFKLHFQPKVYGLLVLEDILRKGDRELDFCLLMSSLAAILGGLGFAAYTAANLFMDAFVYKHNRESSMQWTSLNWGNWQTWEETGNLEREAAIGASQFKYNITPDEGIEAFRRILYYHDPSLSQLAVFPGDLQSSINQWIKLESLRDEGEEEGIPPLYRRSELSSDYAAPVNQVEHALVDIWQRLFGFDRVGTRDDFFELGGDSLKAMTAAAKIHKRLHVEVPLTEFFNRPTIEKLSQYIDGAVKQKYAAIEAVEEKEYYPLSASQKRLYMLQQIDPGSEVYSMAQVAILEGEIDRKKLQDVFLKLIDRHESFRTSFITVEDEVVQKIHEKGRSDFKAEYYDLTASSAEAGDPAAAENIVRSFIRPFHLDKAPLLRMGLIKLQEEKHILMIDNHHIISDGTSQSLFMQEFTAYHGDKEDRLSPLNIQYKDYAVWQNSEEGQKAFQLQEEYWLKEFAGEIPAVNLPLDFPRPDIQSFEGRLVTVSIGKEHSRLLKEIAREQGVSLFAMLLAIYNIFAAKVTGRDDICIGTEIAGRGHSELQDIQGLFLNTLVLRNFPHKDKTFQDFLEELMNRILQAFENQEYPFEMLTEKVLGKRDVRRNPFFDVMLVWQNMDMEPLQLPGLTIKPYQDEIRRNALVDMTIYGYEQEEFLVFALEYNTSLFKESTIQRFISYFKEIIAAITANKEIKLKEIKISHDLQEAAVEVFQEEDEEFGF